MWEIVSHLNGNGPLLFKIFIFISYPLHKIVDDITKIKLSSKGGRYCETMALSFIRRDKSMYFRKGNAFSYGKTDEVDPFELDRRSSTVRPWQRRHCECKRSDV